MLIWSIGTVESTWKNAQSDFLPFLKNFNHAGFLLDSSKTTEWNSGNFGYIVENSTPDTWKEPFGFFTLNQNYLCLKKRRKSALVEHNNILPRWRKSKKKRALYTCWEHCFLQHIQNSSNSVHPFSRNPTETSDRTGMVEIF